MRILHVLAEKGFAGGENQLLATLGYLQESGVESVLALNPTARFLPHAERLGLEVHEVRIRNNIDVVGALALRKLFRAVRADLIHFTDSRAHKVGALAGLWGAKRPPRIVTRRMDYPLKPGPYRRWLYGGAVDAVVVISRAVREVVLGLGIDPGRVTLIYEGVDTARLGELRGESSRRAARSGLGLEEGDLCGVTAASLHIRKGHDVLLRALGRIRVPEGQRLVWIFAGEGPERAALEEMVEGLGGNLSVRLPGQVKEMDTLLSAADLFCLPSRYEGLGVALLEAMAAGVPCIASRVGGMAESVIDRETGLHVPVGDEGALAGAIQGLIDDPDLARRLAEGGRRRTVEQFDVKIMGESTLQLYRQVAGRAGISHHR